MTLQAGKDSNGIPRSAVIDDITRFMVAIQADEHRIHLGKQFFAQYVQSVSDTNDISAMVFSTPSVASGKWIHLIPEGQSMDQVEFKLIEQPSVDEGEGTSVIVPFNRYRDSARISGLFDAEPVKATGGVLEWTGVGEELDSFSIGADIYLVAALESTADGLGLIWVDLGNAAAATMVTNATAAIDAAQAASNNDATVEATDGTGDTIDVIADGFGINGNLAITVITGANMAAGVNLTGGIGAPNTGGDTEIHGVENSITVLDKTDAANANITTTIALIDQIIGMGAATPARDAQQGDARGIREWILKQSTQYCLYMKSLNVNDNIHTLSMFWYEVEHKNAQSEF
jgi:hypothetical protein